MIGKFFRKRPDDPRVPPGQSVTEGFPVLTYGPTPRLDPAEVEVRVSGLADPGTFSLEDLRAMPRTDIRRDFHCVTHWSKMGVGWSGVRTTDLMHAITLREDPTHVMLHCYGGYTTNLTLDDFLAEDCLLAYALEGGAIAADHGGPLRVIVPHLYAWKSAKWLAGLEFMRGDRPGFWERNGYHRRGDPFAEQRYG